MVWLILCVNWDVKVEGGIYWCGDLYLKVAGPQGADWYTTSTYKFTFIPYTLIIVVTLWTSTRTWYLISLLDSVGLVVWLATKVLLSLQAENLGFYLAPALRKTLHFLVFIVSGSSRGQVKHIDWTYIHVTAINVYNNLRKYVKRVGQLEQMPEKAWNIQC